MAYNVDICPMSLLTMYNKLRAISAFVIDGLLEELLTKIRTFYVAYSLMNYLMYISHYDDSDAIPYNLP